MFGTPEPAPYEALVLWGVRGLALLLLIGLMTAPSWRPPVGRLVRWSAALLALAIGSGWEILAPARTGIEGAGRILYFWPWVLACLVLFAGWSWRARKR